MKRLLPQKKFVRTKLLSNITKKGFYTVIPVKRLRRSQHLKNRGLWVIYRTIVSSVREKERDSL